jgi:primary-amine oxidase
MPKVPSAVHNPHSPNWRRNNGGSGPRTVYETSTPPSTKAPYENVFCSLSNDEAASVIGWLHEQESLNLTNADEAGDWDNSIMVVELYTPNKTDAVKYFDKGGEKPDRWAVASLSFGAVEEPYIQDWVIGPLPISENTMLFPDTFSTHTPDAKIRVYDMDDSYGFIRGNIMEMKEVLHDILDSECFSQLE